MQGRIQAQHPTPLPPQSPSVLWLTQQMTTPWGPKTKGTSYSPTLWRTEIQTQGVPRVTILCRLQGRVRPASSSFWRPRVATGCGPTTLTAASVVHGPPGLCSPLPPPTSTCVLGFRVHPKSRVTLSPHP